MLVVVLLLLLLFVLFLIPLFLLLFLESLDHLVQRRDDVVFDHLGFLADIDSAQAAGNLNHVVPDLMEDFDEGDSRAFSFDHCNGIVRFVDDLVFIFAQPSAVLLIFSFGLAQAVDAGVDLLGASIHDFLHLLHLLASLLEISQHSLNLFFTHLPEDFFELFASLFELGPGVFLIVDGILAFVLVNLILGLGLGVVGILDAFAGDACFLLVVFFIALLLLSVLGFTVLRFAFFGLSILGFAILGFAVFWLTVLGLAIFRFAVFRLAIFGLAILRLTLLGFTVFGVGFIVLGFALLVVFFAVLVA